MNTETFFRCVAYGYCLDTGNTNLSIRLMVSSMMLRHDMGLLSYNACMDYYGVNAPQIVKWAELGKAIVGECL